MSDIRLPPNPGFLGAWQWKPFFFGVMIVLTSQVLATEFLAYRFGQFGLRFDSDILANAFGLPIYWPVCWVKWAFTYRRWLYHATTPYTTALCIGTFIGVLGVIVGFMVRARSFNWRARALASNAQDLYGSTRWATRDDIKAAGLLRGNSGILLGAWDGKYLYDDSDQHVLVSAPSRTGKTYTLGVTNALLWEGSMLVVDVKEELYKASAGFRQHKGHICVKFSPLDPGNGIRLNPLSWIRFGTSKEISDVQKLSQAIGNPGNEGADSSHWNDTSISLIDGMIIHEAYKCKLLNNRHVTMRDISDSLSPYDMTFEAYLKEMSEFEHDPAWAMRWEDPAGNKTMTHPVVREKAMEALQRDVKEGSSVLSTAKKRFRLYADPQIAEATSGSDLEIEDLVDHIHPVSLYLVLPPGEIERLAPLIRVILQTVLPRLTEHQVPRRHELLWLLDEFPQLGYMPAFRNALSYAGGYGMRFFVIAQDLSQITDPAAYGPNNSIIPNAHIKVYFTVSDLSTAKKVSEEIGPQTIQHAAIQFGHHKGTAEGRIEAQSAHVQNTKRDLIEAAELRRLKLPEKIGRKVLAPGEEIILVFGFMPIKAMQVFSFLDPAFLQWMRIQPTDQSRAFIRRDYVTEAYAEEA